ncbi:MAG: hypothetical protein WCJ30_22685, partial [Deltaproteobacteria bacterium]
SSLAAKGTSILAPVRALAESLTDEDRGRALWSALSEATDRRNRFSHQAWPSGDELRAVEQTVRTTLDDLLAACQPLATARLVSLARIIGFSEDGVGYEYELRDHSGAVEHAVVCVANMGERLEGGWCYLVNDGKPALSLAPFVWFGECGACGRLEMFHAHGIAPGPSKAGVTLFAITSPHETRAQLTATSSRTELASRWREARMAR